MQTKRKIYVDGGEGDKTQEKIPDSPATTQKNGTCVVTRDEESQAKDQEKKASPISKFYMFFCFNHPFYKNSRITCYMCTKIKMNR